MANCPCELGRLIWIGACSELRVIMSLACPSCASVTDGVKSGTEGNMVLCVMDACRAVCGAVVAAVVAGNNCLLDIHSLGLRDLAIRAAELSVPFGCRSGWGAAGTDSPVGCGLSVCNIFSSSSNVTEGCGEYLSLNKCRLSFANFNLDPWT